MTKEQFDNYKFGVKTEVQFRGEWTKIKEVDFSSGFLGLENGYYVKYNDEVGDIRESNN